MQVIFCKSKHLSSLLIRLVTGWRHGEWIAPWSHVAVLTVDGFHVMDSFYPHDGVINPRSLETFLKSFPDHSVLYSKETTLDGEELAYAWMESMIGRPYGNRELWGYLLGRNTYNDQDPDSGMDCFHFAARALNIAGIQVSEDRCDSYKLIEAMR